MQWKGRIAPGSVAGQPAESVDLMPTLCALAESAVPERVDGRDLRPVLFERRSFERELFWRTGEGDAYRWGDWKYIKTAQGGEMLFDVESDPAEKMNRSSDATRLAEMRERYRRLLASGLGSITTG
jgi:choline-sulfatase